MTNITALRGESILIDEEDLDDLSQFTWRLTKNGYVVRSLLYKENGRWIRNSEYLHRRILKLQGRDQMGDHINGNKLDNRRSNLRKCTNGQNQCNSKLKSTNKSGFKGVCKSKGKWMATMTVNKKNVYLGLYNTPEEAHAAYCKAAKEIHGEFFKG